jgi:NitT/TauT family transport system substrate-binding protein
VNAITPGVKWRLSRIPVMLVALAAVLLAVPAVAETHLVRVATQYGLTYLPLIVMEHDHLIESNAKAAGLGDVAVEWTILDSGNVMNDALLTGSIDLASTGVPPFVTLWAKTRGRLDVRGVATYNALPLILVTRNPNVRTIRDFTPSDRIALPGVQSSSQALMLQMECERVFGPGNQHRLDALTVSRGHPDAMAGLMSGTEITAHFSAPAYEQRELADPAIHEVLRSTDVYGGPGSIGVVYTTASFHDANPGVYRVALASLEQAIAAIEADHRRAASIYLAMSKDKMEEDALVALLDRPEMVFDATPHGIMRIADYMARSGVIKQRPDSWKDLFFPEIYDRAGD